MKIVFILFATAFLLTLGSGCVKSTVDPDACSTTLFSEDVNPKLMAWQEATTTYSNDPSVANCNAYKLAGNDWLDAISSFQNCTLLYTASWREAVEEAKAELAAEPCN